MNQWKVLSIGLLVLSAASVAMADDMKVKSGAWYLNTGYGNTGIIGDDETDNDSLQLKLGEQVFTVNLGREVFRNNNLTLSLEGGINFHPEDTRCITPGPEIKSCSVTSGYAARLGALATIPLGNLNLTFGLGAGQYILDFVFKATVGDYHVKDKADTYGEFLDFVAGVEWNLSKEFAVGAEVRHFQYKEIELATAIGINAKIRF